MKQNKTRTFIILAILVVVRRAYDVITTGLYIPDLEGETNIIVQLFGAGWTSVIIIQSLTIAVIIFLLHYYLFRYKPNYPADRDLNKQQLISFISFNDTSSYRKVFYKLPANKQLLYAATGYIASMTLIAAGFVVGTSTTLLLISEGYRDIYRKGGPAVLYTIILLAALFFVFRFYNLEYKKYMQVKSVNNY